ncbi:MAG: hypothetical protein OXB88_10250 [Bacteriovoracales bacterium]|nr:hypothetical protein [Bacteriovoracales bacterium]
MENLKVATHEKTSMDSYYKKTIKALLPQLSHGQQVVLTAMLEQGIRNASLAKQLNISKSGVSQLKKRTFEKIGKLLVAEFLDEELFSKIIED